MKRNKRCTAAQPASLKHDLHTFRIEKLSLVERDLLGGPS